MGSKIHATKIAGDVQGPVGVPIFDGDLGEGEWQAAGFVIPHWVVGHLTIYDENFIQVALDGKTPLSLVRVRD